MPDGIIFINYRRDDSRGDAGRLYDRLHQRYPGKIFKDVDSLEAGVEWHEAIAKVLRSADVCIVLIGRNWLSATNSAGKRRLDDPRDTVRVEILTALSNHVRLFPVLVGDADMPAEDQLPADLRPLARRNAIELTEQDWDECFNKLVAAIERSAGWSGRAAGVDARAREAAARESSAAAVDRRPARRSFGGALAVAAVLLLIGGLGWSAWRFGVPGWPLRQQPPAEPVRSVAPPASNPAAAAPIPVSPAADGPVAASPPRSASAVVEAPTAIGGLAPAASPLNAARARVQTPRPPPKPETPSPPPLTENPPVFVRCAGVPEICAALRSAFDGALERASLPSVRGAERAEVAIDANVSLVDQRADQQFGTTFVVRTYSVELSGEALRSRESVPMPPARSFSFDARFGRDRLEENARLIADSAVEKVRAYWKKLTAGR